MAALVEYSESNGVGEVVHDSVVNLNLGNIDNYELDNSLYPILRGNNSYEKYIRLKISGSFTEISNVIFYKLSGAFATDEDIKAIANQVYSTPVKTTSIKAVATIPVSIETALVVESTEGDPAVFTGAGYSKYLVLQGQVGAGCPPGVRSTKVLRASYDEV